MKHDSHHSESPSLSSTLLATEREQVMKYPYSLAPAAAWPFSDPIRQLDSHQSEQQVRSNVRPNANGPAVSDQNAAPQIDEGYTSRAKPDATPAVAAPSPRAVVLNAVNRIRELILLVRNRGTLTPTGELVVHDAERDAAALELSATLPDATERERAADAIFDWLDRFGVYAPDIFQDQINAALSDYKTLKPRPAQKEEK